MDGELRWDGHRTWYRVVGELDPGAARAPVVVCHGGPGATHDYVAPIAELHRTGRACVLYDQLGAGRSEHLPDADASFWTPELFARELAALVEHLGMDGRYHVVGQSWGGLLAYEHALRHPPGLLSIVAADAPASIPDFAAGCGELRATLPADVQAALDAHEAAGTTRAEEYQRAMEEFYTRFLCRLDPWPDALVASFDAMEKDPTVYAAMNGPSEFHVVGSIREWDVTDRLGEIDVPVLLVSGGHDEVRPWVVEKAERRLRDAEWVLFPDASHTPHLEEPERFLEVVGAFLERVERAT
ncbi:MAG TPA: proline iminopeptidase-family hydrolase [Solirubrobacteraceae bacterium]|nr:proline iminopeptidase-family hydrolase [Solirubrobacteraceae bacterium]HSD79539.1 proline iminopeptidase-family hydrolase [Solirubrobacteraceae bacterium]